MLVTNKGQMIRVKVSEIRIAGRNTQGVEFLKHQKIESCNNSKINDNND